MAELGSINVIDVNRGTQPISRTAENRALDTALNVTKVVLEEGVEAGFRRDLQEEASNILKEVQSGVQDAEGVNEDAEMEATKGAFLRETRKLNALADQTSDSSVRTMAQQRMQALLTRSANKFGWMRDALRAEASYFNRTSSTLTAIGVVADSHTLQIERASARRSQIEDEAYGSISSGGLGISTALAFGTEGFAREFQAQRKFKDNVSRAALELDSMKSQSNLSAAVKADSVNRVMQGEGSSIAYAMQSIFKENIQPVLNELKKGIQANGVIIDDWNNVGRFENQERMQGMVVTMETDFNELWEGEDQTSDDYKQSRIALDKQIERLTVLGNMIFQDVTTSGDLFAAEAERSSWNFISDKPFLQRLVQLRLRLGDEWTSQIQNAIGREEIIFQDDVATGILAEVTEGFNFDSAVSYGDQYGGADKLSPNLTADEVNKTLSTNMRQMNSVFGVDPSRGLDDIVRASVKNNIEALVVGSQLDNPEQAPTFAVQQISRFNSGLITITDNYLRGQAPPDVVTTTAELLAHPKFIESIKNTGSSADNQVSALGVTARNFVTDHYQIADRVDSAIAKYNAPIFGIPINLLLEVDPRNLAEDGTLAFNVLEDRIRAEGNRIQEDQWLIEQAVSDAEQIALELKAEITEILRIDANYKYALTYSGMRDSRPDATPAYATSFLQLGFEAIFNIFENAP